MSQERAPRRDRCKGCRKLTPRTRILGRNWKVWAGYCFDCLGLEEWPHEKEPGA